jgi:hypothetical protein
MSSFPVMAPDESAADDAETLQQDILNAGSFAYVSCSPNSSVIIPDWWGIYCGGAGLSGATTEAAYVVNIQIGEIAAHPVGYQGAGTR